jgi:hypothetical protein
VATNPRKHQKQQERRAAKRKAKHQHLTRDRHTGLAERLAAAAAYPVLHSWATEDLWTQGLGWVCLSRELPSGQVAFVVFLVDRYCLGVKDVQADVGGRYAYEDQIVSKARRDFTVREMSPAAVRKLVEGAVAYADALGLHPHPDYARARHIFGSIDAADCTEEFEFGKDGKPFFVAGPNDTPERCRRILKTLEEACGPDGFHYLIPLANPFEVLPESLLRRNPRVIGPDETGEIRDWNLEDQGHDGGQP